MNKCGGSPTLTTARSPLFLCYTVCINKNKTKTIFLFFRTEIHYSYYQTPKKSENCSRRYLSEIISGSVVSEGLSPLTFLGTFTCRRCCRHLWGPWKFSSPSRSTTTSAAAAPFTLAASSAAADSAGEAIFDARPQDRKNIPLSGTKTASWTFGWSVPLLHKGGSILHNQIPRRRQVSKLLIFVWWSCQLPVGKPSDVPATERGMLWQPRFHLIYFWKRRFRRLYSVISENKTRQRSCSQRPKTNVKE